MTAVLSVLGVCLDAWSAEPKPIDPATLEALRRVAREYNALVTGAAVEDQVTSRRDQTAMWDENFPVPGVATGRVVNRRGEPVAGALVDIETEETDKRLGRGWTDRAGRFQIPLATDKYRGLSLTVTADDYHRWAVGGIYGGVVEHRVQLDREVNRAFVDALLAEKDVERRMWMLLEVVGPREFGMELKDIFSYIGRLRSDLHLLIRSGAFAGGKEPPAKVAAWFLYCWEDPADAKLTKPEAKRQVSLLADEKEISGETIEEVLEKWMPEHPDNPPRNFSEPVMDAAGTHALVECYVHYAHWGYSRRAIMVRQNNRWHLKLVLPGKHWSLRPG